MNGEEAVIEAIKEIYEGCINIDLIDFIPNIEAGQFTAKDVAAVKKKFTIVLGVTLVKN